MASSAPRGSFFEQANAVHTQYFRFRSEPSPPIRVDPSSLFLLYVASFDATVVAHTLLEYVSFSALLGALFVISGGIVLRGDIRATPEVNTGFLAVGALLANFVGTTGASMLLIRPMLRTNSPERKHIAHIPIFFIFIVSNCSGLLTPLGDPPLFLGYLRGVPFFWAMRLILEWLFVVVTLLPFSTSSIGLFALLGVDAETGVFMLLYLDLAFEERLRGGRPTSSADLREAIIEGASHGTGADVMKRIAAPMVGGIFTSFLMELLVYPAI